MASRTCLVAMIGVFAGGCGSHDRALGPAGPPADFSGAYEATLGADGTLSGKLHLGPMPTQFTAVRE